MQRKTKIVIGLVVTAAIAVVAIVVVIISSLLGGEDEGLVIADEPSPQTDQTEPEETDDDAQSNDPAPGTTKVGLNVPIAKIRVDASECPAGIQRAQIKNGVLSGTVCGRSTYVPAEGTSNADDGTGVEVTNLNAPAEVHVKGRQCGRATYRANKNGTFNLVIPNCSEVGITY